MRERQEAVRTVNRLRRVDHRGNRIPRRNLHRAVFDHQVAHDRHLRVRLASLTTDGEDAAVVRHLGVPTRHRHVPVDVAADWLQPRSVIHERRAEAVAEVLVGHAIIDAIARSVGILGVHEHTRIGNDEITNRKKAWHHVTTLVLCHMRIITRTPEDGRVVRAWDDLARPLVHIIPLHRAVRAGRRADAAHLASEERRDVPSLVARQRQRIRVALGVGQVSVPILELHVLARRRCRQRHGHCSAHITIVRGLDRAVRVVDRGHRHLVVDRIVPDR